MTIVDGLVASQLDPNSALGRVISTVVASWPEHEKLLNTSLRVRSPRVLQQSEHVAEMIEKLADGGLEAYVRGYRWMCDMVRAEELEFLRSGHYRLSSFEEAFATVYSNDEVMAKYMDGLLLSQVLWSNHALMLNFYIDTFLANARRDGRHLEIGPGHGLLLALAAREGRFRELTGWDVSETSLQHTAKCLKRLGVTTPTRLQEQNVFALGDVSEQFDSVVISEVCEHLERPVEALVALKKVMAPGGRIFVNVPINAPAIDHIYLLRTPEEVVDLVRQAGFGIETTCIAPAAGYSEAVARKRNATISVGVIGVA